MITISRQKQSNHTITIITLQKIIAIILIILAIILKIIAII